jgi:TP901-1 family phage major tail protein
MAAQCGAGIIVSFKDDAGSPAYQVVAGLRSRSISLNAETVDVTSANSTGVWRELLDACGVRNASMSGDGVFTDDAGMEAVRDAFFENELRDAKIFVPAFGTFEGQFKVASLEFGGEYNGEVTASLGLESAGVITFTAA